MTLAVAGAASKKRATARRTAPTTATVVSASALTTRPKATAFAETRGSGAAEAAETGCEAGRYEGVAQAASGRLSHG